MNRLHQRTPLTLKMIVATILVGILVWFVLDHIQTRRVKEIFQDQLLERLGEKATEDRLNFDLHLKAYHRLAKMMLLHKGFVEYIKALQWDPDPDTPVHVIYQRRAPLWYPIRSVLRSFVSPRYALLLDPQGRVREVYQDRKGTIPASLLAPARLLIEKSQNQSFMTNIEGTPFLVTSVSYSGSKGGGEAVLMLASPIDDEFLNYSLGPHRSGRIIALLDQEEDPSIVMSNNIDELPPGSLLSAIKDRYITTGRGFFDYGSSEESIKLASFIATSDAELKINSIVLKERKERATMAFILILSFALVMYFITRRIQGLTLRISDFSQHALGAQKHIMKKGDQLYALEERFKHLTDEIIEARETIKEQAEEHTRIIVDKAFDAIVTINTDGYITSWNPQAEAVFGWSRDEAVGSKVADTLVSPEDHMEHGNKLMHFIADAEGRFFNRLNEVTFCRRYGEEFPAEFSITPVKLNDSNLFIAFIRDVTEHKKAEDALQKLDKLESVGLLAGGIAHDFNNLLAVILNNLYLIKMHTKSDGKMIKPVESAEKASIRAQSLTQQLLTFSKGGEPVKRLVNIKELINESISLSLRGSNVQCESFCAADLWNAKADEGQINQVFSNILINADHSMPDGGTISVNCENVSMEREKDNLLNKEDYVKISIKDQGMGISKKDISRIFDPYFTTKEKGSGLGLSTVYSIVSRHGGHIDVESSAGDGTVFSIYLPASRNKAIDRSLSESEPITGEGRILIMDDDELVRDSLGQMLEMLGYRTESAIEGGAALDSIRNAMAKGRPFDVVIMDLTIPGGRGGEGDD